MVDIVEKIQALTTGLNRAMQVQHEPKSIRSNKVNTHSLRRSPHL